MLRLRGYGRTPALMVCGDERASSPDSSGGKEPGNDEQRDTRPRRSVSASEQPSRDLRPESKAPGHRVRSDGCESRADDRKHDDERALGDLSKPFQDHAIFSVGSIGRRVRALRRLGAMDARMERTAASALLPQSFHHRPAGEKKSGRPAQRRAIASTSSLCTALPPPKLFIASSCRISSASRLYP